MTDAWHRFIANVKLRRFVVLAPVCIPYRHMVGQCASTRIRDTHGTMDKCFDFDIRIFTNLCHFLH